MSQKPVQWDTGRCSLGIKLVGQVCNYLDRLKQIDKYGSPALVRHAFAEQRTVNLSWYERLKNGQEKLTHMSLEVLVNPSAIKSLQ